MRHTKYDWSDVKVLIRNLSYVKNTLPTYVFAIVLFFACFINISIVASNYNDEKSLGQFLVYNRGSIQI